MYWSQVASRIVECCSVYRNAIRSNTVSFYSDQYFVWLLESMNPCPFNNQKPQNPIFIPDEMSNKYEKNFLAIGTVALDTRFGCLDENLSPDSEAQRLISSVLTWFELWFELEGRPGLHHWIDTKNWKKFVSTMDYFNE